MKRQWDSEQTVYRLWMNGYNHSPPNILNVMILILLMPATVFSILWSSIHSSHDLITTCTPFTIHSLPNVFTTHLYRLCTVYWLCTTVYLRANHCHVYSMSMHWLIILYSLPPHPSLTPYCFRHPCLLHGQLLTVPWSNEWASKWRRGWVQQWDGEWVSEATRQ
jgi:hypothetical protein